MTVMRSTSKALAGAWRNVTTLAALATVITLWFTSQSSQATQEQVRIAAHGQIDIYYKSAVQQLKSDYPLERIAGIQAFERLAQEYPFERDRAIDLLKEWLKAVPDCNAAAAIEAGSLVATNFGSNKGIAVCMNVHPLGDTISDNESGARDVLLVMDDDGRAAMYGGEWYSSRSIGRGQSPGSIRLGAMVSAFTIARLADIRAS